MSDPFFTVIVPPYDDPSKLAGAFECISAQSYSSWEAIVTSSSPYANFVKSQVPGDGRFRFLLCDDDSKAAGVNASLKQAKGEWICFLGPESLYSKEKLAVHYHYVTHEPDPKFFFTNVLNLPDLLHTSLNLSREIQVIRMLSHQFIHLNSVCVSKHALEQMGACNPDLPYGWDYDLLLRLLLFSPADHISETTCVLRDNDRHPDDGQEEKLFDHGKSAIAFLNKHAFSDLIPLVDSQTASALRGFLLEALAVAIDETSNIYALGPNPALLLRILQWAWHHSPQSENIGTRKIVRDSLKKASRLEGMPFNCLWKAAHAAAEVGQEFEYKTVSPGQIAHNYYWFLESVGDRRAIPLKDYLARTGDPIPDSCPSRQTKPGFVAVACQKGQDVSSEIKYGAFQATVETSRYLMKTGCFVVLIGLANTGLGLNNEILFVGIPEDSCLVRALDLLAPLDTVIGISRSDILKASGARKHLIYHHNPFQIEGDITYSALNKLNIPVITVSRHSKATQVSLGLNPDSVHVVPNGIKSGMLHLHENGKRMSHSLVQAGHMVGYKGLDISLKAFDIIKGRFPDATFRAYGASLRWSVFRVDEDDLLEPHWTDPSGNLDWSSIQKDVSGFSYMGEADTKELVRAFSSSSLLLSPSRFPEPFSLVPLEAQACGCIPILPRLGGFPETVQDGVTGYLYGPNTPEELAGIVIRLWENDLPTQEQRLNAQRWVSEMFSWRKAGEMFLNVIDAANPTVGRRRILWEDSLRRPVLRVERIASKVRSTLRGQNVSRWPDLLWDLWTRNRQRQ
jgi:glycosyltransferase involved in cell wall biosynthesis